MFDSTIEPVVSFVKANKVFLGVVGILLGLVVAQNTCTVETAAEEVETSTSTETTQEEQRANRRDRASRRTPR